MLWVAVIHFLRGDKASGATMYDVRGKRIAPGGGGRLEISSREEGREGGRAGGRTHPSHSSFSRVFSNGSGSFSAS